MKLTPFLSPTREKLPYRPNVQMIIFDPKGKVLILLKTRTQTYWEFPQGGIDKDETPEETIRRELKEEANITDFKIVGKSNHIHRYDWPIELQKQKGFRGQEQYIYFIKANDPTQVKINQKEGFHKHKWVTFQEAIQHFVIQNQIEGAKKVWKEFEPVVNNHIQKKMKPTTPEEKLHNPTQEQITVVIAIVQKGNQLLLTKRSLQNFSMAETEIKFPTGIIRLSITQPKWEFPGGIVNFGESIGEATIREVKEETGSDVRVDRISPRILTQKSASKRRQIHCILIPVWCTLVKENAFTPNHEIDEIKWINRNEVKSLEHDPVTEYVLQEDRG